MIPHPDISTDAMSARLLAEHQAAQRRQLIGEMADKYRRDNPHATQAEVDRYLSGVKAELERLHAPRELSVTRRVRDAARFAWRVVRLRSVSLARWVSEYENHEGTWK